MSKDAKHRPDVPLHLKDYDLFMELFEWANSKKEQTRHWIVTMMLDSVKCQLTWNVDGRCMWIDRIATSPEEAVSLALNEFYRRENSDNV